MTCHEAVSESTAPLANALPHGCAAPVSDSLSVADLKPRHAATITALTEEDGTGKSTSMAQRLAELGFIVGETVSVLRRGPGGREPIAVQVGDTVFALRRLEAGCIRVRAAA
jgi:ferrous iron transport protein A